MDAPGDEMEHAEAASSAGVDLSTPPSIPIGTRVEIVSTDGAVGTVIEHWVRADGLLPNDMVAAPYRVRLDDGRSLLWLRDSEDSIRRSDAPPLLPVHNIGGRVECKLEGSGEWLPGTVYNAHLDWVERDTSPYEIRLDDGRDILFWGPQDCIRASSIPAPEQQPPNLRFKVGDRVCCNQGGDGWSDGTVIKLWYANVVGFEDDYVAPYQIQLDAGDHIFAPVDVDECIRRSTVPAPQCWICYENDQTESNLIVRECACRGEDNGFVHIQCLVRLAQKKVEDEDPSPDESSPFQECITCKQPFGGGSHMCSSALRKAFYETYKDRDIGDFWNKVSTTDYVSLLREQEEYDQASTLLNERISEIRSKIEEGTTSDEDVSMWRRDLANFLLDVAEVCEATGNLSEMKVAVDESRSIVADIGGFPFGSKATALDLLARHAYETGDKMAALGYLEELLALAKASNEVSDFNLSQYSIQCGNLNLDCGNKERGLEQLSTGIDIMAIIYGKDHVAVRTTKERIRKIEQGTMDKLPSDGISVIF